MGKRIDISGERFGKLVALEYSHTNKQKKAVWKCVCDCGNIHYVTGKDLRCGNTKSCGCTKIERARKLKYKDGRSTERLHAVWQTMLKRCYCKTCKTYEYYGARGISVCDDWKEYANFREWAYNNGYDDKAPTGECTIDRINYNGNYEPSNCRWVSMDVQRKNKRYTCNAKRNPVTGRFEKAVIL